MLYYTLETEKPPQIRSDIWQCIFFFEEASKLDVILFKKDKEMWLFL